MSHSFDNKNHFGWLDLRVNTQFGIIVVYIMAKSTLHHVFSISINANMPYKLKLIVNDATKCCNAQQEKWWYNAHLMWVLHVWSSNV
jgi:hypothetical protein